MTKRWRRSQYQNSLTYNKEKRSNHYPVIPDRANLNQFPYGEEYFTTLKLDIGIIINVKLNLISETKGIVEIITEDVGLIDRIFYK